MANNPGANDPRLEAYLVTLERSLRPMSVSDRAEIVTELKSHVLSALARDPEQPLDAILAALGEPQTVANRYLLERGQQPVKPPISPVVKWLVIGFLGTLAMLLLFAAAMVWRFVPLLKVHSNASGSQDRVSLLGGLIDFDGVDPDGVDPVSVEHGSHEYEGSEPIEAPEKTALKIKFASGKIELRNSDLKEFTWSCRSTRQDLVPRPVRTGSTVVFDLARIPGVRCDFSVPRKIALELSGVNGKIGIAKPAYALDLTLANGKVELQPDPSLDYKYQLSVGLGKKDEFESSAAKTALPIRIELGNGKISREH